LLQYKFVEKFKNINVCGLTSLPLINFDENLKSEPNFDGL